MKLRYPQIIWLRDLFDNLIPAKQLQSQLLSWFLSGKTALILIVYHNSRGGTESAAIPTVKIIKRFKKKEANCLTYRVVLSPCCSETLHTVSNCKITRFPHDKTHKCSIEAQVTSLHAASEWMKSNILILQFYFCHLKGETAPGGVHDKEQELLCRLQSH